MENLMKINNCSELIALLNTSYVLRNADNFRRLKLYDSSVKKSINSINVSYPEKGRLFKKQKQWDRFTDTYIAGLEAIVLKKIEDNLKDTAVYGYYKHDDKKRLLLKYKFNNLVYHAEIFDENVFFLYHIIKTIEKETEVCSNEEKALFPIPDSAIVKLVKVIINESNFEHSLAASHFEEFLAKEGCNIKVPYSTLFPAYGCIDNIYAYSHMYEFPYTAIYDNASEFMEALGDYYRPAIRYMANYLDNAKKIRISNTHKLIEAFYSNYPDYCKFQDKDTPLTMPTYVGASMGKVLLLYMAVFGKEIFSNTVSHVLSLNIHPMAKFYMILRLLNESLGAIFYNDGSLNIKNLKILAMKLAKSGTGEEFLYPNFIKYMAVSILHSYLAAALVIHKIHSYMALLDSKKPALGIMENIPPLMITEKVTKITRRVVGDDIISNNGNHSMFVRLLISEINSFLPIREIVCKSEYTSIQLAPWMSKDYKSKYNTYNIKSYGATCYEGFVSHPPFIIDLSTSVTADYISQAIYAASRSEEILYKIADNSAKLLTGLVALDFISYLNF